MSKLLNRFTHWLLVGMSAYVLAMVSVGPVSAQTITQGFTSDSSLLRGSIIAITKDDKKKIELVSLDQIDRMYGIVVNSNDSAVTLTEDQESIFVATAGRYDVLISDLNGSIKAGDYLTLSSVNGIAMKAEKNDRLVIGRAAIDLDLKNNDLILSKQTIKSIVGKERNIAIGRVLTDIGIGRNPIYQDRNLVPSILQRYGEAVAGKPVSSAKIYGSISVMIVASAIAASLIYSGVRSSLISIGRNPLSKRSIMQGLIQVVIIGIVIFVFGLATMYLILKL